jgi:hypothetical protein
MQSVLILSALLGELSDRGVKVSSYALSNVRHLAGICLKKRRCAPPLAATLRDAPSQITVQPRANHNLGITFSN